MLEELKREEFLIPLFFFYSTKPPIFKKIKKKNMSDFSKELARIQEVKELADIEESMLIEKGLSSNNAEVVLRARRHVANIQKREEVDIKSMIVDPMALNSSAGYKDKPFSLSYDVLRSMAKVPIIKAIIETRKEQVANYLVPQDNRYLPGFVIEKKTSIYQGSSKPKVLTRKDRLEMERITNFLLNCGNIENTWHADTFDDFGRKLVGDTLILDQATFEIITDRAGRPVEFLATDAATYRIAETYNDYSKVKPQDLVQGYAPSYVQVYQSRVTESFYPWELCFGVRNPTTDIRLNGYGRSELEDLIQTITDILNATSYNSNYFKVGSNPGGILTYSGTINRNSLEELRQSWGAQVAGVMNFHKIPILNGDKFQWVSTHQTNREMEYSKYLEFLIWVACAVYKIDPSEVNFPHDTGGGSQPLFGGDKTKSIQYSKDKGLKPLLKKIQFWINKYIIDRLNPEFKFVFKGIEDGDEANELEHDIKLVSNLQTVNEIRNKRGLPDLPKFGDLILNPIIAQQVAQEQMMQQQNDAMAQQGMEESPEEGEVSNPFDQYGDEDDDPVGVGEKFVKGEQNSFNRPSENQVRDIGRSISKMEALLSELD